MAESTRHRHGFEVYWRLGGDRSIERLRDALIAIDGKAPSLRTLYEWSSRFRWQFRIVELEQDAKAAEDAARLEAQRDMAERQAKAGLFLQQKGMEWLVGMEREQATPDGAVRAIIEGAKLERLARGEPTERSEVKGQVDARLAFLSDEELAQLTQTAERIARAAEEHLDGKVAPESE